MCEVGIASLFTTVGEKVKPAILFIDSQELSHCTFASRDLILQLARGRVVEIKLTPIITL